MSEIGLTDLFRTEARGDWIRLRTLLVLRWLAIAGQAGAVLIGDLALGLDLPTGYCFVAISASVWFNIVATLVQPPNKRLSDREAMLSLLFDLGQLSALLMLTGGLGNPFAVLIIAPVTISATVLRLRSTAILGGLAIGLISLLAVVYRPLVFADGQTLAPPALLVSGMWASLVIAVVFLAAYARRVTVEASNMSRALTATQMALAREHRLSAIGGLAAAAAHELGTPLSTIKLASTELMSELQGDEELLEDAALIRKQADRCRDILQQLSKGADDDYLLEGPVTSVIQEAAAPHLDRGVRMVIRVDGAPEEIVGDEQPTISRRPEIIHGLRNLIQNAMEFAAATVWVDVVSGADKLRISVGDDGPGYPEQVLDRLGDPYLTRRETARRGGPDAQQREGLGLGLFIAKTLLERTGAEVTFVNGSEPGARRRAARSGGAAEPEAGMSGGKGHMASHPPGAIVVATWPQEVIVTHGARGLAGLNRGLSAKTH